MSIKQQQLERKMKKVRNTNRQREKTGKLRSRQTNRQTDKQTDRQTEEQPHKH